ncbi:sulfate ABC transporter ATP-binding protein [Caenibius tardaugens NBRC 16725]|uniref:Sulfate ABC transporter ATP-binding protein n=1 Tax=Caenibius tardaugens NBRC 16725 TaxID=1219035 RepID=U2YHN9_9SPHN|nr:sulfate/molybdate ABC transporter ATP-binding protein [Caenibius tardaugens]AZI37309.1 sulfate/molybdate ABC transporter ATP-binding protein [Caenibius tardaugens NBRC 16725]GAD47437.1 sulfate ABC transporter ATP-binding protein [Caenibius tardaugens NBRC 16725]
MIRLDNISKRYGGYQALDSINLDVRDGEFLALLGPSGSGKTTLLRIVAGLAFPDQGSVLFNGEDVTDLKVAERKVGFVFQHYALFKHMTVADNVGFGLSVRPRRARPSKDAIRARAEELLDLVQLRGLGNRYPAQLSGGQRQRVALARALAVEPQLLLLDEPFGALDAQVRKELRRWLRHLHDQMGLTSIFVTHDQEEALELADRVVVMDHGVIEQVGTPEDVYMAPRSRFVSTFVGETNSLPVSIRGGQTHFFDRHIDVAAERVPDGNARLDFRPHDVVVCGEQPGSLPLLVTGVYRRGGEWRVEGELIGVDRTIEVNLDANQPAPEVGKRLGIKVKRAKIFQLSEA